MALPIAWLVIAAPALAAPADDQFAVAAGHYAASRWQEAANEFRYYLEQHPDGGKTADATFFLGEALIQLGQYTEAQPYFTEVHQKHPGYRYARQALFRAGEAAWLAGRRDDAQRDLGSFVQQFPDDPLGGYALPYLAESALAAGNAKEAAKLYTQAMRRFPQGPLVADCRFGLARSLELTGQTRDAERFYRMLAATDGPFADNAQLRLGILYQGSKRLAEADEALTAFESDEGPLAKSELRTNALYWLGSVRAARGDFAGAVSVLDKAIGLDPKCSLAASMQFAAADALRRGNDLQAAAERYRRLREDRPDHELADDALLAELDLAVELDRDDVADLAAKFDETYVASHLRGEVRQTLGCWLLAREQYDEAIAVLERLVSGERLREGEAPAEPGAESDEQVDVTSKEAAAGDRMLVQASNSANVSESNDTIGSAAKRDLPPALARESGDARFVASASWYYLALAYIGKHRYEDAIAALDRFEAQCFKTLRFETDREGGDSKEGVAALSETPQGGAKRSPKVDHPPQAAPSLQLVGAALVARATALMGLRRYEEALPELRDYLESQPDGPDAARCWAHLAVSLAELGRLDDAAEALQELERREDGGKLILPTLACVAEAAYRHHDVELARALFTELARDGNPREYVEKGRSGLAWLDFETDPKASAEKFQKLILEHPGGPHAAEAALMRARALEKVGKPGAAIEMYMLLIEKHADSPLLPDALLGAARLLEEQKLDAEAAALVERFVREFPKSPKLDKAIYLWAWVLDDLDRGDEADEKFKRLADEFPDSTYWGDATYRLAERAARAEDYRRAGELADRLIASQAAPDVVAHALYLKGQVAAAQKQWAEVEQPLTMLLTRFPETQLRLPAQYWLAEAAYRQQKFELAGRRLADLLVETHDRNDPWLAMVPLRLAQVFAHAGEWDEAYELASGIARKYPDFRQQYEVDYLLGRCLQSRLNFDFEAARAAYERVVRSPTGGRTETAAMAQWMIGETYFLQKNYEQAIRAYYRVEQLFEQPRWQSLALLQAGKCYEVQGRLEQAIEVYERLARDYAETESAKEAARRLHAARERLTLVKSPQRN